MRTGAFASESIELQEVQLLNWEMQSPEFRRWMMDLEPAIRYPGIAEHTDGDPPAPRTPLSVGNLGRCFGAHWPS
jgi:hypothetical protein